MTTEFDWTDDLLLHVEAIDNDHKKLFELASNVLEATAGSGEVGNALGVLVDYTKQHFRREEESMAKTGYPGLAAQKTAHHDLVLEIDYLAVRITNEGEAAVSSRVVGFFREWMCSHIMNMDLKYAEFIRSTGKTA